MVLTTQVCTNWRRWYAAAAQRRSWAETELARGGVEVAEHGSVWQALLLFSVAVILGATADASISRRAANNQRYRGIEMRSWDRAELLSGQR